MPKKSRVLNRHRSKWIGFIIAEGSAIGVLLLAGTFAWSSHLTGSTLGFLINIVILAAAAAVAFIPIVFFAVSPILPRADR
jgi:hypothetical protein